jgi:uncharacterized repeat protein (TIGR03837 family)
MTDARVVQHQALRWDVFCRVIDNHGDLGVCWRLASQLAARGQRCRLWVDDVSALAWMALSTRHVAVGAFDDAAHAEPGNVVIEAFGCDPPPAFVRRMRQAAPPVWINLEYLSAQDYVDRSHGLASPQTAGPVPSGAEAPGAGLTKWFFFPGFTPLSGGLLRGSHTAAAVPTLPLREHERAVLVFAYAHARLAALLDALDVEPTLVLAAPGPSQGLLEALFRDARRGRHLRLHRLPWLDQPGFDSLLSACALNVVRGEDSLVQALWAGAPFVWNIYAQHDGAHAAKLEALLGRMLDGVDAHAARDIRCVFRAVNGFASGNEPLPPLDTPRLVSWRAAIAPWLEALRAQEDLVTRLVAFVARQRRAGSIEGAPR